jgi:hypothetical protein
LPGGASQGKERFLLGWNARRSPTGYDFSPSRRGRLLLVAAWLLIFAIAGLAAYLALTLIYP